MEKKSVKKFTAKFKLQVVAVAEETNNVQAANRFDIGESNVRNWRKQKEKLKKTPSYKYALRGSKCKWPFLDNKVATWVSENRECGYNITRNAIRLYALKEARKQGIPEFIASAGWCTRFLKRHDLVTRKNK